MNNEITTPVLSSLIAVNRIVNVGSEKMMEADKKAVIVWVNSCRNSIQLANLIRFHYLRFVSNGEISMDFINACAEKRNELERKEKEENRKILSQWAIDRIHGKI